MDSPAGLRGVELLDTPISNKGTDFDDVGDSYAAAIRARPDLALDKPVRCVLGGTQQTLAERASRPSNKSQIDGRILSRRECRMSDVSTEYLEFSFGPFRLIPERQLLLEDQSRSIWVRAVSTAA